MQQAEGFTLGKFVAILITSTEMDTSRFKRREIQTRRSTPKPLEVSEFVSSAGSRRPQTSMDIISPAAQQLRVQPVLVQEIVPVAKPVPVVQEPAYAEAAAEPVVQEAESAPRRAPMDMELPGGTSPLKRMGVLIRSSRWVQARRWASRGLAGALVLLIAVAGVLFSQGYIKLHRVFKGGAATATALKVDVNPSLLKGEGDGRINILLLGRGGGSHEAPDLTDTLLLASIDPVNNTAALISIPRDLYVKLPGQSSSMKINAAWETGEFKSLGRVAPGSNDPDAITAGFETADATVESVLGVSIHYNALVDFKAFQQAVDTVNGVTVNVPSDLIDPTMAWENNRNPVLAKAGIQQFDGGAALRYVRSRETTSDFARSERQRAVLLALKTKVVTLGTLSNPIKISGLMNAFGNNVKTDLSLNDASRLYSTTKNISDSKFTSVGLSDGTNHFVTTSTIGGQSVVLPAAGQNNYSDIQKFIRGQLKDGYIVKENAKILVLNGTTMDGLAAAKADELKSYGYNVIGTAAAPSNGWAETRIVDLSHGKDKYTANYLQKRFNVTVTKTLPDASIQTNGADFVIIVGSDETTTPKT